MSSELYGGSADRPGRGDRTRPDDPVQRRDVRPAQDRARETADQSAARGEGVEEGTARRPRTDDTDRPAENRERVQLGRPKGGAGKMEQPDPRWRKSTHSGNGGVSCVEAGHLTGTVLIRDTTQHGQGPTLTISPAAWTRFTASIKH